MDNQSYTQVILQHVANVLKTHGFRKLGNNFLRDNKSVCLIVQIQKSGSSTSSVIKVTVNLGIYLWSLAHLHWTEVKRPAVEISHWRARIGHVSHYGTDKWWTVSSKDAAEHVANEITITLEREVLPLMESLASEKAIRDLWSNGSCPGLTDAQRLKNLSELEKIVKAGLGSPA
jgi:Domain of unknown function (DUF4304)